MIIRHLVRVLFDSIVPIIGTIKNRCDRMWAKGEPPDLGQRIFSQICYSDYIVYG